MHTKTAYVEDYFCTTKIAFENELKAWSNTYRDNTKLRSTVQYTDKTLKVTKYSSFPKIITLRSRH